MYFLIYLVIILLSLRSYDRWVDEYFDDYQQQFLSYKLYYTYILGYFLNVFFTFKFVNYLLAKFTTDSDQVDLIFCVIIIYNAYLLHRFLVSSMEWLFVFLNLDTFLK